MKFNTPEFVLFFFVVAFASRWAGPRLRIWGLLAASLIFYAWWNVPLVGLMGFSILVDFAERWARETDGVEDVHRRVNDALSTRSTASALKVVWYLDLALAGGRPGDAGSAEDTSPGARLAAKVCASSATPEPEQPNYPVGRPERSIALPLQLEHSATSSPIP